MFWAMISFFEAYTLGQNNLRNLFYTKICDTGIVLDTDKRHIACKADNVGIRSEILCEGHLNTNIEFCCAGTFGEIDFAASSLIVFWSHF